MSNVTAYQKAMMAKHSFLSSLSKFTRTRFIHEMSSTGVEEQSATLKNQLGELSPKGNVHVLLAAPGNAVAGTMLKVVANYVASQRPVKVTYVDNENYIATSTSTSTAPVVDDGLDIENSFQSGGASTPRKILPHCMAKLQDAIVRDRCDDQTKASALSVIQKNIGIYSKFFASLNKFTSVEIRNVTRSVKPAKPADKELICYLNPRKQIIRQMENAMDGRSVLVVDSKAESVMNLGSRAHFGLDSAPQTLLAHKRFLQSIAQISEQRRIHVSDSLYVPLVRHIDASKYMARLATPGTAIGAVMASVANDMPSWVATAERYLNLARQQHAISQSDEDRLLQKCSYLDAHSANSVHAVTRKLNHDRPNLKLDHYVERAVENIQETFPVYADVYGDGWINVAPQQFVKNCAKRDYEENKANGDLLFPEFVEEKGSSPDMSM